MKQSLPRARVSLLIYFAVFALGALTARLPSAVNAESPKLEVDGYCSRGDLLVRCVGPSNTSWGAQGLLPRCSRDEIVVSEGFGKWKCAQQRQSDK